MTIVERRFYHDPIAGRVVAEVRSRTASNPVPLDTIPPPVHVTTPIPEKPVAAMGARASAN